MQLFPFHFYLSIYIYISSCIFKNIQKNTVLLKSVCVCIFSSHLNVWAGHTGADRRIKTPGIMCACRSVFFGCGEMLDGNLGVGVGVGDQGGTN